MKRKTKRLSIYLKAIRNWGIRTQLEMAQEEATELALAVRKMIKNPSAENQSAVAGEIADVEIMIEQLKVTYDLTKEVGYIKRQKVRKLKKRLEDFDLEWKLSQEEND